MSSSGDIVCALTLAHKREAPIVVVPSTPTLMRTDRYFPTYQQSSHLNTKMHAWFPMLLPQLHSESSGNALIQSAIRRTMHRA